MTTSQVPQALLDQLGPRSEPARPAASNRSIDQQEFLRLFITQLQYQDPLSPLNADQLTAQLAQFSSLEQLTGINTRLDTLAVSARQSLGTTLLGLVGKRARFDGSALEVKQGQASEVRFTLDDPAARVTVAVEDGAGRAVRTVELGSLAAGEHGFTFDGRNDLGGTVPDGTYRIAVTRAAATDPVGTPVPVTSEGIVDGVDLTANPPALLVGGRRLTLEQVREVRTGDQT
jgi:flagellar basal-body rod modification protein FlgD